MLQPHSRLDETAHFHFFNTPRLTHYVLRCQGHRRNLPSSPIESRRRLDQTTNSKIFPLKTNAKINILLFRETAYGSRGVQKMKIISLIETRLRAATAFSSRRNCTISFCQHLCDESVTFVSKLPRNSPSRPSLREPLEISKFSMVKK